MPRDHTCHATNCGIPVQPELLMCRKHWFMLPKAIRNRVWNTYRKGQCDDMNPSIEYCKAARDAVTMVAKFEGLIPDTALYDLMIERKER